jgi:hypothetical protein
MAENEDLNLPSPEEMEALLARLSRAEPGPDPAAYDGIDLRRVVADEAGRYLHTSFSRELQRLSEERGVSIDKQRHRDSLIVGAVVLHILGGRDEGLKTRDIASELRRYLDNDVSASTLQRLLKDLTARGLIEHQNDRGRSSSFFAIRS